MIDYNAILKLKPFIYKNKDKKIFLLSKLIYLTKFHYDRCIEYKNIIDVMGININNINDIIDIPFIPVRLFKKYKLSSISTNEEFKLLTSSGTTMQSPSMIILDKKTSLYQRTALTKIVSNFIGSDRLPMLIIDSPTLVKNRSNFSARGAAVLGFSVFGSKKVYALDENMDINFELINNFIFEYGNKKFLIFGFTYIIWEFFYKKILNKCKINFSKGIMLHGGGWKKIVDQHISKDKFRLEINKYCNIKNIHDYYGMVEQTGTIYIECENGYFHTSIFSDIIVRNPLDFSVCEFNKIGIIQLISLLPKSYPGHSILSEDMGMIIGEDDCSCGRSGKYFVVQGRIKSAEIRGCSDTYERN